MSSACITALTLIRVLTAPASFLSADIKDNKMDAIKRLQMEMSKHRDSIERLNKDLINEKSVLKQILKSIEDDTLNENESQNYGLVYECSNKICLFIRQRKELQRLIMMKMEIYTNHSEASAKKRSIALPCQNSKNLNTRTNDNKRTKAQ